MFAEIVINRKTPGNLDTFTYEIPENGDFRPGQAVWVPFRKSKVAGVIVGISEQKPTYEVREILEKISEELIIPEWQMKLCQAISDYYLCPISKIIPLFLPKKIWSPGATRKQKAGIVNKKSFQDGFAKMNLNLTTAQAKILKNIEQNPCGKFLIHGVTGSGKTEIYLRLAKKCIVEGSQALILVPEISLTPQLIEYFQRHFEVPVAVIHSRLTEKERRESWLRIFRKESSVVIGSRSALFAPFQNLQLIVMDEEHEWTYKQEQMPRYHARFVAEKMAELTGATLVMGSATPSLETFYKAQHGEYRLLELKERIEQNQMPKTTIIDMREEMHQGNFSIFSDILREKLAETLARKKQAILFMNRRGVAPAVICRDCGYVSRCSSCRVAFVIHKDRHENIFRLLCHHCGQTQTPPLLCPSCESHRIRWLGTGTQRVEEEIKKFFSLAKVFRADRDTITKKQDYHDLYEKLQNREIDILIGTQLIAKGLDIPNVHLIGIILADTSLHFPDFRAAERTFQLITQVSGRAGRREEQGEVILQTYSPEHYAVESASRHDYRKFYGEELKLRKEVDYPPFSQIIKLSISNASEEKCRETAENLENQLAENAQKENQDIKITASPAAVPYQTGKFHWNIFLRGQNPEMILRPLLPLPEPWKIDVDPLQ